MPSPAKKAPLISGDDFEDDFVPDDSQLYDLQEPAAVVEGIGNGLDVGDDDGAEDDGGEGEQVVRAEKKGKKRARDEQASRPKKKASGDHQGAVFVRGQNPLTTFPPVI